MALLSALGGLVSGVIAPLAGKAVEAYAAAQEANMELALAKAQFKHEIDLQEIGLRREEWNFKAEKLRLLAKKEALESENEIKRYESDIELAVESDKEYSNRLRAIYENQPKTSIVWINAFNAFLRPFIVTIAAFVLFTLLSMCIWEIVQMQLQGAEFVKIVSSLLAR